MASAGTISWHADGNLQGPIDCDTPGVIHSAMCGRALSILDTDACGIPGGDGSSCCAGNPCDATGTETCIGGTSSLDCQCKRGYSGGYCEVENEGCTNPLYIEYSANVIRDDGTCATLVNVAEKSSLRTALKKLPKRTKKTSYGQTSDTTSEVYKTARSQAREDAKVARRAQLASLRATVNWRELVIEDTEEEFEGYTDVVLAKRQARKDAGKVATIRYRAVPDLGNSGCDLNDPDLVLSKEDGIDVVDPEVCVTMQVEGETGVVKQTVNGAAYDMVCSDGTTESTTESKTAGETFECYGRVWDIGSIGTEMDATPSSCPTNTTGMSPAEYINAQCCQCP